MAGESYSRAYGVSALPPGLGPRYPFGIGASASVIRMECDWLLPLGNGILPDAFGAGRSHAVQACTRTTRDHPPDLVGETAGKNATVKSLPLCKFSCRHSFGTPHSSSFSSVTIVLVSKPAAQIRGGGGAKHDNYCRCCNELCKHPLPLTVRALVEWRRHYMACWQHLQHLKLVHPCSCATDPSISQDELLLLTDLFSPASQPLITKIKIVENFWKQILWYTFKGSGWESGLHSVYWRGPK